MKIWMSSRTDMMPMMNMEAENATDRAFLEGFRGQITTAREKAVEAGWCTAEGEAVGSIVSKDGIDKLQFPILIGTFEFVPPEKFPPAQEDRTAVRLVSRRQPRKLRV